MAEALFRPVPGGEQFKFRIQFQAEIFEANFRRAAGVHLQASDPPAWDLRGVGLNADGPVEGRAGWGARGRRSVRSVLVPRFEARYAFGMTVLGSTFFCPR